MNKYLLSLLLFQSAQAQPALKTYPSAQINCLTYTSGAYSGEVNASGRPDGYGMVRFADGVSYVGQLSDGQVRGQGMLLEPKSPSVTVARWEKGQKVGQWFRLRDKELKLLDGAVVQRSCSFTTNLLAAIALTSGDPANATLTAFLVVTSDPANASVYYSATLSAELNMDGPMLDFQEPQDRVLLKSMKNGDAVPNAPQQSFSAVDEQTPAKLEAALGKPLPPWLYGADHRLRSDNHQKFFANARAVEAPQGSYGMLYGSDGKQTAFLRVARIDKYIAPLGFYQEIFHRNADSYRYALGDLRLDKGLHGNGIIVNLSAQSQDFELSAGDIQQQESPTQVLHSGMEVSYFNGAFFVAIGDWDADNRLGSGYIIAPERNFFYRGEIKLNTAFGSGASPGPQGKTLGLRYSEEPQPSIISPPAFAPLKGLTLFQKPFEALIH